MKKKIITMTMAGMLAVSFLSACGQGSTDNTASETASQSESTTAASGSAQTTTASSGDKKVINLGSTGYWCNEVMDPAAGDTYNGWYIGYYGISQQLFKLNENFEPENWLVESFEQKDDNNWEFTLRDDVNFHNGSKMTAESVKKCFERTIKINDRAKAADWIKNITADGQKLKIETSRKVTQIANELSDPLWVVYYADEEVDYEDGKSYFTGPYKLQSFSAFDETVVVRNDDYWGEKAKADEVHFITLADDDAAIMALNNNEIDMIYPVYSGAAMDTLSKQENVELSTVTSSRGEFLQYNMNGKACSDVNVRNAIAMCIDREGYSESITHNMTVPSYGIYSDSLPFGGTKDLKLTVDKMDVEGAKKLLEEAGYSDSNGNGILDKDGTELEMKLIIGSTATDMISMCNDLQSKLSTIGIKLNVEPMESTMDELAAGNFDIGCISYAMAPTGTPDYFMNLKFASDSTQNQGGFKSERADELIKEIAVASDTKEINEKATEVQQIVLDECAYTFFAHKNYVVALSKNLTGFVNNPTEYYCLDEYLDKK